MALDSTSSSHVDSLLLPPPERFAAVAQENKSKKENTCAYAHDPYTDITILIGN